jgi:hypothetical protein
MKTKTKEIYIHETDSLSAGNGIVYITGKFGTIEWNCDTLFKDLPFIIELVMREKKKNDEKIINLIKTSLK